MGTNELNRYTIQEPRVGRPHLVILGAGASRAALVNGDKTGHKLPLMCDLIETIGLGDLFSSLTPEITDWDFESLFSALALSGEHQDVVDEVERRVFEYFSGMELPAEPTIYDFLVLSLRPKDVIATFNWDPLLVQACTRNSQFHIPRRILYLHGNTGIGHCPKHRPIRVGLRGARCPVCGDALQDLRLLYPVRQKNYNSDPLIAAYWRALREALCQAFVVTIFGYSAPATDVEAIELLQDGWGKPSERNMEQLEMIDIKDSNELRNTWNSFIHTHHYETTKDFYSSTLGLSPRRSCDAMWMRLMEAEFTDPNPIPRTQSWDEIRAFYGGLVQDEDKYEAQHGRM